MVQMESSLVLNIPFCGKGLAYFSDMAHTQTSFFESLSTLLAIITFPLIIITSLLVITTSLDLTLPCCICDRMNLSLLVEHGQVHWTPPSH